MIFIPTPGVTFLVPSESGYHLHFILTPPVDKEVLIVGITSTEIDSEFTLSQGDHPFIKHKSYINYPKADIVLEEELKRKLETGEYILKETANENVIKYIGKGLLESRSSLPRHRNFYKKTIGSS